MSFEEAVAIAKARAFGVAGVSRDRLVELTQELTAGGVARLRSAAELGRLWADRLNTDGRGAA